MSLMTRFEHGAIRKGFILEEVSMTTSDLPKFLCLDSSLYKNRLLCYSVTAYLICVHECLLAF